MFALPTAVLAIVRVDFNNKMGNDASKDFSIDEKIETVSKNIWTLYKCTNVDGCPLSIFIYDLTAPHCKPQFVENSAKVGIALWKSFDLLHNFDQLLVFFTIFIIHSNYC